MRSAARQAWRNRIASLLTVAVAIGGLRCVWPDAEVRNERLVFLVLGLGYGHLGGAFWFARQRLRRWFPQSASAQLVSAFLVTSAGVGFGAYRLVLMRAPSLVLLLLGVATWHVFENDVHLARSYACGRAAPVSRSLGRHGLAVALSAATVAWLGVSWIQRDGGRTLAALPPPLEFTFEELFAATTLYHLVSWLAFSLESASCARRRAAILASHLPGLWLAALASRGSQPTLAGWIFAADLYLYWSVLHVVQTLAMRGRERPVRRDASAACAGD